MTGDLPNARTAEHSRARWTTYLLYACLALDLVAIASGLAQHGLLSRVAAGEHLLPQEARANDARHGAISRLQILVFIITAIDRKSTRLNSSHVSISYAVFCL